MAVNSYRVLFITRRATLIRFHRSIYYCLDLSAVMVIASAHWAMSVQCRNVAAQKHRRCLIDSPSAAMLHWLGCCLCRHTTAHILTICSAASLHSHLSLITILSIQTVHLAITIHCSTANWGRQSRKLASTQPSYVESTPVRDIPLWASVRQPTTDKNLRIGS